MRLCTVRLLAVSRHTALNYRQTRQALTSRYLIFLSLCEYASYCNETVELGENEVKRSCFQVVVGVEPELDIWGINQK